MYNFILQDKLADTCLSLIQLLHFKILVNYSFDTSYFSYDNDLVHPRSTDSILNHQNGDIQHLRSCIIQGPYYFPALIF